MSVTSVAALAAMSQPRVSVVGPPRGSSPPPGGTPMPLPLAGSPGRPARVLSTGLDLGRTGSPMLGRDLRNGSLPQTLRNGQVLQSSSIRAPSQAPYASQSCPGTPPVPTFAGPLPLPLSLRSPPRQQSGPALPAAQGSLSIAANVAPVVSMQSPTRPAEVPKPITTIVGPASLSLPSALGSAKLRPGPGGYTALSPPGSAKVLPAPGALAGSAPSMPKVLRSPSAQSPERKLEAPQALSPAVPPPLSPRLAPLATWGPAGQRRGASLGQVRTVPTVRQLSVNSPRSQTSAPLGEPPLGATGRTLPAARAPRPAVARSSEVTAYSRTSSKTAVVKSTQGCTVVSPQAVPRNTENRAEARAARKSGLREIYTRSEPDQPKNKTSELDQSQTTVTTCEVAGDVAGESIDTNSLADSFASKTVKSETELELTGAQPTEQVLKVTEPQQALQEEQEWQARQAQLVKLAQQAQQGQQAQQAQQARQAQQAQQAQQTQQAQPAQEASQAQKVLQVMQAQQAQQAPQTKSAQQSQQDGNGAAVTSRLWSTLSSELQEFTKNFEKISPCCSSAILVNEMRQVIGDMKRKIDRKAERA